MTRATTIVLLALCFVSAVSAQAYMKGPMSNHPLLADVAETIDAETAAGLYETYIIREHSYHEKADTTGEEGYLQEPYDQLQTYHLIDCSTGMSTMNAPGIFEIFMSEHRRLGCRLFQYYVRRGHDINPADRIMGVKEMLDTMVVS